MENNFIEVELRGPLTEKSRADLERYLASSSCHAKLENRLFIDYTTFTEGIGDRSLDVRVRMTNGKPAIVVKRGEFGGDSREEVIAPIASQSLEEAIRLMAMLGYRRGVMCDRGITRYNLNPIEIAIQDVRVIGSGTDVHSSFFELEIQTSPSGVDAAASSLRELAANLELPLYSKDEWTHYVEMINLEANQVFDFDKDPIDSLSGFGGAP